MGGGVTIILIVLVFAIFGRLSERLNLNLFTLLMLSALVSFLALALTGNLP